MLCKYFICIKNIITINNKFKINLIKIKNLFNYNLLDVRVEGPLYTF